MMTCGGCGEWDQGKGGNGAKINIKPIELWGTCRKKQRLARSDPHTMAGSIKNPWYTTHRDDDCHVVEFVHEP